MPTTPVEKFEADLHGTGALVDITASVSRTSRIEHVWGRTEWTATTPRPGTLRFSVDNQSGQFTPGNPLSGYAQGFAIGCIVQWTMDGRVRRFRMGTPELTFPTGGANNPMITVTCYDVLQSLSRKAMRSMFDETVMSRDAYLFWPLSESAGAAPESVVAADIARVSNLTAGNALTPRRGDSESSADPASLGWAQGTGPGTDGRASLVMWPGAVTPPALGDLFLRTDGFAALDANEYTVFNSAKPAGLAGTLYANHYSAFGISMWINPSATAGYPAFVSGTNTASEYVLLAATAGYLVLWRPKANSITIARVIDGSWNVNHGLNQGVARGATTHIAVAMYDGPVRAHQVFINGVGQGLVSVASTSWAGSPRNVYVGGYPPSYIGLSATAWYGFAGTISNVSLHGSPGVYRTTTASGWWPNEVALYEVGAGLSESAPARVARLVDLLGDSTVASTTTGAPQPFVLGDQDTAGQSLLDAMGDALRAEGANLDAQVVSGTDTIRVWLDSSLRATQPAISVDVQDDSDGPPEMSFDMSGVAAQVTVKNSAEQISVLWTDRDAPAQWVGTSASVSSALMSTADALLLAKMRSLQGRIARVVPTVVAVNTPTSKNALGTSVAGLRPGVRVRLTGMPSAVLGYSQVDCELIGMTETYGLGQARYTMRLAPITLPDGWFDPQDGTDGPWRFDCSNTWDEDDTLGRTYYVGGWTGSAPQATFTSSATTLTLLHQDLGLDSLGPIGFTTDSGDYPIDLWLQNGSERIRLNSAPGAVTPAPTFGTGWYYQLVTGVTRGVQGTTGLAGTNMPATAVHSIENLATSSGQVERTYFTF